MANVIEKDSKNYGTNTDDDGTIENKTNKIERPIWLLTTPKLTFGLSFICIALFIISILSTNFLVSCIFGGFAWFFFFDLILRLVYTYGGEFSQTIPKNENLPRSFAIVSLIYQFIILPILFLFVIIIKINDWELFYSGKVIHLDNKLPAHIYLALIGYEAKDFFPQRGTL